MKKILLIFAAVSCALMMAACGLTKNEPVIIPDVDPTALITLEDVAAATGYQPVLDGGAVKHDGNTAKALYRSEPIGQGDVIEITVTQYNDNTPIENVWYAYDTDRSLRLSAEEVAELGESAYIAFPSINIYDRGCYVKLTAGSGSDDNQRNLLLSLARTAISRLEEIMPEPVVKDKRVDQK